MNMKIQFYILGFSLFFLNGCFFDTNEINNSNNKSNIDPSVSAENTNIKPMKSDYKQFFILAKDVRFDPNLAQLEARRSSPSAPLPPRSRPGGGPANR